MLETIITAVVTGAVTLIGILIANGKAQAVTDTKLEELTREVREHNNFAKRMPVVEEKIKVINHRLDDLEVYHRGPRKD
ncbi:MAG: hypothetical protein J6S18_00115 [Oscillospiraceae bacterium]|nr:hypothetical protein [Oscillospiraceae bacterium]